MFYWQLCLSVILLIFSGLPSSLTAEESPFRFDPAKVETGVVYQYVKSNIDGSHRGQLSLYVAAKDRLESLEMAQRRIGSHVVIATMDWKSIFSR